jgi:hypothetical protein
MHDAMFNAELERWQWCERGCVRLSARDGIRISLHRFRFVAIMTVFPRSTALAFCECVVAEMSCGGDLECLLL